MHVTEYSTDCEPEGMNCHRRNELVLIWEAFLEEGNLVLELGEKFSVARKRCGWDSVRGML